MRKTGDTLINDGLPAGAQPGHKGLESGKGPGWRRHQMQIVNFWCSRTIRPSHTTLRCHDKFGDSGFKLRLSLIHKNTPTTNKSIQICNLEGSTWHRLVSDRFERGYVQFAKSPRSPLCSASINHFLHCTVDSRAFPAVARHESWNDLLQYMYLTQCEQHDTILGHHLISLFMHLALTPLYHAHACYDFNIFTE